MICLLFFFSFLNSAETDSPAPDEIAAKFEHALETATGKERLDILLELSEYHVSRHPQKVILYATRALELARELDSKVAMGRSHIQRAGGFLQSGNLDGAREDYRAGLRIGSESEHHGLMGAALNGVAAVALKRGDSTNALANFQRAIRHIRQAGDRLRLAGIFNNISLIHYRSGELRKALDFMLKALRIYEKLDQQPGVGIVLNSIGNVYNRLNNPDQAMSHFQSALKIALETDNLQLAVVCRVNIGEIHKDRGHFSEAMAKFVSAHTDAKKLDSLDYMAVCLNNIGDVFHRRGLWRDALNSYQQSLELFQRMNAKPRMVASHLNMGNLYLDLNRLDLAETHLKLAVRLAVDTESRSMHRDAVWSLIRLYENKKDLAKALKHYREYTTLQTLLFSRENYAQLLALQAEYESEQRLSAQKSEESSIRIRQLDRKRRILVTLFLIAVLAMGIMILLFLYRRHRLRTRTEMELREAYARMERIARFDNVTRLYNRHSILERIDIEMVRMGRTWRPFCLIMLDVDDFKSVNDTYGHECGDRMLRHLAELVRNHLRQADVAARWGGDEILIMLPETDMEGGAVLAGKLRSLVEATPMDYRNRKISLTVTMGINVYNRPGPVNECIRGADRAMYAGKKMGKNTVVRLDEVCDPATPTVSKN